ncbi:MAG TPA: cytochrome c [Alphaproteobacteria bacterium]|nr:cytochrome c [Alphaproteobacteria bacterium]
MAESLTIGADLRRVVRVTAAAVMVLAPAAAAAQDMGDPARGVMLARTWCTGCHLVEPGGRGSDAAPSFMAIANDEKRPPAALRGWLTRPHPPMPNMNLSRAEIDDIVAYLRSLKTAR